MEQLLTFAAQQWYLLLALVVIIAMLVHSFVGAAGVKNIPPGEAVILINRQNAVVLDVRTDDEFKQGHIINSLHIPVGLLASRIKELEQHKSHPLVVICRTGQRSTQACSMLRKHGFESLYGLSGGIVAWQSANLPLAKG
ncbi:MAG: rhodanese-like domain-containing protein [Gammaproteobacteria bacterium]|nr:rhodanese-like domain-containing protein [Gammaproteobacteria bacterium]